MDNLQTTLRTKYQPKAGSRLDQAINQLDGTEQHIAELESVEHKHAATLATLNITVTWQTDPAQLAQDRILQSALVDVLHEVRKVLDIKRRSMPKERQDLQAIDDELSSLQVDAQLSQERKDHSLSQSNQAAAAQSRLEAAVKRNLA